MLEISLPDYAEETIIKFIEDFVGNRKVVIGLSGGIDSSLTAYLSVKALGRENVLGVHLPEKNLNKKDLEDARDVANWLGIDFRVIEIDDFIRPFDKIGIKDRTALGNIKVRIRMTILYSIANEEKRLVVASSNKSELLTGYFTKYGDGAGDLHPIGDLYKTQVRLLSKKIGMPEKIINKVPTAGLWEGQTDEDELGIKYDLLDKILYGIEQFMNDDEIANELNIDINAVKNVRERVENTRHKRVMVYIPKIGLRTVGIDFRE